MEVAAHNGYLIDQFLKVLLQRSLQCIFAVLPVNVCLQALLSMPQSCMLHDIVLRSVVHAQSSANRRTDQYGGPIENRTRFALEVGVGHAPRLNPFTNGRGPLRCPIPHVTVIRKLSAGFPLLARQ